MEIVEIYLSTVDSTNAFAKLNGSTFAKDKITCVIAEEQTAGRGQFGRRWVSPRGVNLLASLYFRLPSSIKDLSSLASLLAISIKKVLVQEGLAASMKFPNDVLLNGKKIAGALCEVIFQEGYTEVILGFGLNVNTEAEDLASIDQPAASLKNETGRAWDREGLLKKIEGQFLKDLQESGFFIADN